LGKLPEEVTEDDLNKYFSTFGELTNSYIIYDFDTKKSRGFGFIEFKSNDDVEKVLGLEHKIGNHFIHISKMKLKEDIKKERGILQDPTNVGAKSDSKGSSGDN
jgi:RNA recognition motif. (a.k.a. RRM, RBD, or RNP domain)